MPVKVKKQANIVKLRPDAYDLLKRASKASGISMLKLASTAILFYLGTIPEEDWKLLTTRLASVSIYQRLVQEILQNKPELRQKLEKSWAELRLWFVEDPRDPRRGLYDLGLGGEKK